MKSPVPIAIIIIKNEQGDFFVHQRKSDKKTFPNLYGLGAGGHIEENEEPEAAAQRELFEETGLKTPIDYLFFFDYKDNSTWNHIHVFQIVTDVTPSIDKSEWQWSGWMTSDEVNKLVETEKLCPDDIAFWPQIP